MQDPRTLVATLLHQVLRQLPAVHCSSLGLGDTSKSTDSLEGVFHWLNAASAFLVQSRPTFLVVDGLSGCDRTTRNRLLPLLFRLGDKAKLLLTSRQRDDVAAALEATQSIEIEITEKVIQGEIKKYIMRKLKPACHEDFSDEFVVVRDHEIRERVLTTLAEGSEGT